MNRIAIFAHYDRDGIIDDYVIYYLRGLRRLANRILFVSDCELRSGEAAKLEGLAELVFAGRHGEYDFGSWKRGFARLNYDLSEWDEVIVANDSCYAPIFPFEHVFDKMSKIDCDFWGPSAVQNDKNYNNHLCSYFLVFRHSVLCDEAFIDFWKQIAPQPEVKKVIELYEIGLSQLLIRRGYRWKSSMPPNLSTTKTDFLRYTLPQYQPSWLKVRFLRDNPLCAEHIAKHLPQIYPHYPRLLIDTHLTRIIGTAAPSHHYYPKYEMQMAILRIDSKIKRRIKKGSVQTRLKIYMSIFGLPPIKIYSTLLS
jgi:lipopolysaccharide biosynthesis protein